MQLAIGDAGGTLRLRSRALPTMREEQARNDLAFDGVE